MTHPLSTQALMERAATASNEPDLHHVEAAYRSARALALLTEDDCTGPDFDFELAADVAALEMALASSVALARRLYDRPEPEILPWLRRISDHYATQLAHLLRDIDHPAVPVTP